MLNFMPSVTPGYFGATYGSNAAYGSNAEQGNTAAYRPNAAQCYNAVFGSPSVQGYNARNDSRIRGLEDPEKVKEEKERLGIKDPSEECQTCKNRKYKDGSDEMVSYKSPTKISPESAAAAVRSHEQEHVSNAYAKAAQKNGKVIAASVSIHTAICPECGRTYISGGTTHTQIKYYNEENPYQKSLKSADRTKYSGMNLDYAV